MTGMGSVFSNTQNVQAPKKILNCDSRKNLDEINRQLFNNESLSQSHSGQTFDVTNFSDSG